MLCQLKSRALPRSPPRNQSDVPERRRRPVRGHQRNEAAHHDEEKHQIRRTGDGPCPSHGSSPDIATYGATRPSYMEEVAHPLPVSFAEDRARVGIDEHLPPRTGRSAMHGAPGADRITIVVGARSGRALATRARSSSAGRRFTPLATARSNTHACRPTRSSAADRSAAPPVTDMMKMTTPATTPQRGAARTTPIAASRAPHISAHWRSRL